VFREGQAVATTTGTSATDSTVVGGRAYSYTVVARDAAGNLSDPATLLVMTPPGTGPVRLEAENATIFHGTVDADHPGFSGAGFVNYTNEVGSYVEWTVNAAAAGPVRLTFRYANGTPTNRPMDIRVNGAVVSAGMAFNSTTTWENWTSISVTLNLDAGANTVRATATTANGGPNVDFLEVS
jgi:Carbohydrate binding module (family 35)